MSEEVKNIRLSKAAREFNVGTSTIVEFLAKKGQSIDPSPNTKLTEARSLGKSLFSESFISFFGVKTP